VSNTIIHGVSNKAHDGFLGDSWIGSWVNVGAGTTSSNLLNTYGEITMRVEVDGPRHRTGMQFLGTVIGDHAKLAIMTRLMTGTVIGTGAMVATSAPPPATVRRFAWLTDSGERTYDHEKFVQAMSRMMERRGYKSGPAYLAALQRLHGESASPS
jgi:hypothetical protein